MRDTLINLLVCLSLLRLPVVRFFASSLPHTDSQRIQLVVELEDFTGMRMVRGKTTGKTQMWQIRTEASMTFVQKRQNKG